MRLRSIKEILMDRDGCTEDEAKEMIEVARNEFYELLDEGDMDSAERICEDHFGLEPDYLDDLIW